MCVWRNNNGYPLTQLELINLMQWRPGDISVDNNRNKFGTPQFLLIIAFHFFFSRKMKIINQCSDIFDFVKTGNFLYWTSNKDKASSCFSQNSHHERNVAVRFNLFIRGGVPTDIKKIYDIYIFFNPFYFRLRKHVY